MLRRGEERSLNNYTSYLEDYECSSLALDGGRMRIEEEIWSLRNKIKLCVGKNIFLYIWVDKTKHMKDEGLKRQRKKTTIMKDLVKDFKDKD